LRLLFCTVVQQIKIVKMETKNTPEKFLFQLTTEEFDSLFRGMLNDIVPSLVKEGIKEHLRGINVDQPDTIGIEEAAKGKGLKLKSIYSQSVPIGNTGFNQRSTFDV
jgi:hypothetical protein